MSAHPRQLYAVPFTEADQARLGSVGFSCGEDPWARAATEWLLGPDVLDSIARRRTAVWLFELADRTVVGFASLGPTRWRWPLPNGTHTNLAYIPMVGLAKPFHGQPPDPDWRYATQIVGHLIAHAVLLAADWPDDQKWLVLVVHPENKPAIRCYERCGFELVPNPGRKDGQLVMKVWLGD